MSQPDGCTRSVASLRKAPTPDTITRRFAAEFKNGATKRDAKIRAQLMSRALSGKSDPQSATCLIFCAKSMLHLYDRPEADPRAAGDSFIGFLELLREQQALLANAKKPIRIEGLEVESDKDWMDRGEYSPNGVGHIESSDEFPISSAPV